MILRIGGRVATRPPAERIYAGSNPALCLSSTLQSFFLRVQENIL